MCFTNITFISVLTFSLSLTLMCISSCGAAPINHEVLVNETIKVPQGSRYISTEHLLCTPSTWQTIVPFFLGNYMTHVATVKSIPGETTLSSILTLLFALAFPFSGLYRGVAAIFHCTIRCKTPLETACKAGALCVVVRTEYWRPQGGDIVKGVKLYPEPPGWKGQTSQIETKEEVGVFDRFFSKAPPKVEPTSTMPDLCSRQGENGDVPADQIGEQRPATPDQTIALASHADVVNSEHEEEPILSVQVESNTVYGNFMPPRHWYALSGRTVHGTGQLPRGYALSLLPINTSSSRFVDLEFDPAQKDTHDFDGVSMSSSLSRAIFAIFQTIYASLTLYKTRGDQIDQFGYAAFGLTVTPYLMMSIVNLVSNMVTPDFASVYLVRDNVMIEAERRMRVKFDRVVGRIRSIRKPESVDVEFKGWPDDGSLGMGNPSGSMVISRLLDDEPAAIGDESLNKDQAAQEDKRFAPLKIEVKALAGASSDTSSHTPTEHTVSTKSDVARRDNIRSGIATSKTAVSAENIISVKPTVANKTPVRKVMIPFSDSFDDDTSDEDEFTWASALTIWTCIILFVVPISVMGALTHFEKGRSTQAQRTWIMTWLVLGFYIGMQAALVRKHFSGFTQREVWVGFAFFMPPAIGGFIVVARMLETYGSCTQLF